MDPLERELDGEGRRGIENNPKGFEAGGVEVIVVAIEQLKYYSHLQRAWHSGHVGQTELDRTID